MKPTFPYGSLNAIDAAMRSDSDPAPKLDRTSHVEDSRLPHKRKNHAKLNTQAPRNGKFSVYEGGQIPAQRDGVPYDKAWIATNPPQEILGKKLGNAFVPHNVKTQEPLPDIEPLRIMPRKDGPGEVAVQAVHYGLNGGAPGVRYKTASGKEYWYCPTNAPHERFGHGGKWWDHPPIESQEASLHTGDGTSFWFNPGNAPEHRFHWMEGWHDSPPPVQALGSTPAGVGYREGPFAGASAALSLEGDSDIFAPYSEHSQISHAVPQPPRQFARPEAFVRASLRQAVPNDLPSLFGPLTEFSETAEAQGRPFPEIAFFSEADKRNISEKLFGLTSSHSFCAPGALAAMRRLTEGKSEDEKLSLWTQFSRGLISEIASEYQSGAQETPSSITHALNQLVELQAETDKDEYMELAVQLEYLKRKVLALGDVALQQPTPANREQQAIATLFGQR